MEKPKNSHAQPMDMSQGGRDAGGKRGAGWRGVKGRKNGTTVIA